MLFCAVVELDELDLLDIRAGALAVEGELVANHLDDLGVCALGEGRRRLFGREVAAVLDGALDELVGFERLVCLLDDAVVDIGFANIDDRVEVMCKTAELPDLLAGKCHGAVSSF